MQKRLFDIGRSDESECQGCRKEEGTERHRLYHCPSWNEVRRRIPEAFGKWKQTSRISKKEWKWQRGIVTHHMSKSPCNRDHFSAKSLRSTKVGASQQKDFKAMSPSGNKSKRIAQRRTAKRCRTLRSILLMAMRKRTS